ncbi:Sodium/nucleoside cotransporter [Aphelenchoides bicaudatus]|nr:Sodium/nucleoside cotransporter [Aphelenchoides bicaudatus]
MINDKSPRSTPSGSFVVKDNDLIPFVPEELNETPTGFMLHVERIQNEIDYFVNKNSRIIKLIVCFVLVVCYHVFLVFALNYNFKKALPVFVLTLIVWVYFLYECVVWRFFGTFLQTTAFFVQTKLENASKSILFRICVCLIVIALIVTFLIFDTANDRTRLNGLFGMCFYVVLMFLTWRPVVLGFLLQFLLGLLVLRWKWGGDRFNDISNLAVEFLEFTQNGTSFVYGFLAAPPNICGMSPVFAFSGVQVVVFFGSFVSLLYYYGIMQATLKRMGWLFQRTLGTTATESLNACSCMLVGQSEGPFLVRPYLSRMTTSELHAQMTSGFSCIAGSLFAVYITFGACPNYLLSATVMTIVANLIVFLALLAFLNATIEYIGDLIGFGGWSLELIFGYAFFPLAYIMGVTSSTEETLLVAQLMGTKTALNEFIAYQKLGQMVNDKLLTPKNAMIATYALCGFSNFSTIGIQLGVLGGMAPERKIFVSFDCFESTVCRKHFVFYDCFVGRRFN